MRQKCICACLHGGKKGGAGVDWSMDSDKSADAQLYPSILNLTFPAGNAQSTRSRQTDYWQNTDTSIGHLWFHLESGCLPLLSPCNPSRQLKGLSQETWGEKRSSSSSVLSDPSRESHKQNCFLTSTLVLEAFHFIMITAAISFHCNSTCYYHRKRWFHASN